MMRRRAIYALVPLAAALAFATAGCGGAAEAGGEVPDSASLAPADALAFATLTTDESSDQWKTATELVDRLPGARERLTDEVTKRARRAGPDVAGRRRARARPRGRARRHRRPQDDRPHEAGRRGKADGAAGEVRPADRQRNRGWVDRARRDAGPTSRRTDRRSPRGRSARTTGSRPGSRRFPATRSRAHGSMSPA